MAEAEIGLVGLGVMGANLARNVESRGFPVAGYDLDAAKMDSFLAGPAKGKSIIGVNTPEPILRVMQESDPDVCLKPKYAGPSNERRMLPTLAYISNVPKRCC